MPSVFITGSNKYGYAVGSTQSVTDTVATQLIGDGNAVLSSTVQLSAKNTSWFADFVNTVQAWVNSVCCLLTGTQTITGAKTFSGSVTLTGAVSGTGMTNYLASPPSIGTTAPGIVKASDLQATFTDSSGTPGNVTNNSPSGRAAFAAGGASVTVTSSLVSASSRVLVQKETADATLTAILAVSPAAGSFTVTGSAAATAVTKFSFLVIN